MYSYHFREWLCFFYFYCICGWCFESAYVSLKKRHLVNRGFLKGPWLPLYGSGAVLVLWLTLPFQGQPILVYFAGALGATILEYFTGQAMVRIFKVRYWDYSNQPFQYKGHICLSSSLAWGFLSLLMVYVVHEPVERFLFGLNADVASVLVFGVTACMAYDFSNALRDALDLREVLLQTEQVCMELEKRAAGLVDTQQLEERLELLKQRMVKSAGRLLLQNPGSRFMTMADNAAEIRERIGKLKKKRKEGGSLHADSK